MAYVKTLDIAGFGLGILGILIFTSMYLTKNISTDIGMAFFVFFLTASVLGTIYFGYQIQKARSAPA